MLPLNGHSANHKNKLELDPRRSTENLFKSRPFGAFPSRRAEHPDTSEFHYKLRPSFCWPLSTHSGSFIAKWEMYPKTEFFYKPRAADEIQNRQAPPPDATEFLYNTRSTLIWPLNGHSGSFISKWDMYPKTELYYKPRPTDEFQAGDSNHEANMKLTPNRG